MARKSTKEYDSFGPWVYEVTSLDELPRLYSSYAHLLKKTLFTIKIPMNITRRNATPDMHLYDRVVMVFESHILILSKLETKTDTEVIEQKVNINDIYAIAQISNLLYGAVELYLKDSVEKIEYNTVSYKILNEFIRIIQNQMQVKDLILDMPELDYNLDNVGMLYCNLIKDIKKKSPNFKLVAFQKQYILTSDNIIIKFINRSFNISNIIDSIFLVNDSMLICINRTSSKKSRVGDAYKYTYYYLPLAYIDNAEIHAIYNKNDLKEFVISIDKYEFKNAITQDSYSVFELANRLKEKQN